MKVTQNTPDFLTVGETPWIIGIAMLFGALFFIGIGTAVMMMGEWFGLIFILGSGVFIICAMVFVRRVQVVFHRPEGWVEIRRRSFRRYSKIRFGLSEIERAKVETSYNDDGQALGRIVLVIPEGQSKGIHPLTHYYSTGSRHDKIMAAINAWLDSARQQT